MPPEAPFDATGHRREAGDAGPLAAPRELLGDSGPVLPATDVVTGVGVELVNGAFTGLLKVPREPPELDLNGGGVIVGC